MKPDNKPTTQEQIKAIEESMLMYIRIAFDLLEDAVLLSQEREALMEGKEP